MASYGSGGQGGPQGSGPGAGGDISQILAQLQRSNVRRPEDFDPATASLFQQQAALLQQQQIAALRPTFPNHPSHHNVNNTNEAVPPPNYQQQQLQQPQYNQQNPPDYTPTATYPPPAAPTPPVGAMFPPGMMAGSSEGQSQTNDSRTANLLSLLNISSSQGAQQSSSQPTLPQSQSSNHRPEDLIRHASAEGSQIYAPAPTSADPTGLLAALMRGRENQPEQDSQQQRHKTQQVQQQQAQSQPQQQQPATNNWNAGPPAGDTQQFLLGLLNRPKPTQNDEPVEAPAQAPAALERSLPDVSAVPPSSAFSFSPDHGGEPHLKFDPSPAPAHSSRDGTPSKAAMFSHRNPFEDLAAVSTSPRNRGSKSNATPGVSASPSVQSQTAAPIQILKKPGSAQPSTDHKRLPSTSSHLESREHTRRKFDSTPTSQDRHSNPPYPVREAEDQNKETVSDAVSEIAGTVDKEAREAIARAEHEQAEARITQDLKDMMSATSNKGFEEAAATAASHIKHELEKQENQDVLDDTLRPEVAKAVREIVDDAAAQGPVADSWESAEAEDEIVVIEETTKPIKVFNFPMKPWISITIQDSPANETRPVLREEAILPIARLKKEFDQIDRNLVVGSETYLAYGMSKAGGLRVIRQSDGGDAKLFTDTKDRIFNIAMAHVPADETTSAKDFIIGTGISGTVYWAQIRDGEKDHTEDAHLEQYGFALPPSNVQEGDAPGGVLKTRARLSSAHAEFFAVGRGKSINFIFPYQVMKGNFLKPNHDRVVDTDRLAKECSLKINTGKAGKDFAFSQDDTVVVSLDKSGRVKFWDVRDLTVTDEDRLPAHKSMEVKEPLMTLTTTPEGEKAWPTSVLLLDKLRPYQKRTALRYLIVGMKQNHTLQLWDLALGKPVQEFNLPHSKESDAVCSVMYHPPSGIIVVGHPTRNSIYFLHLSAPKYAVKGSSQVDYIEKLVAQDTSVPVPDSTAVISGMREYSFANKGVLRSLYISPYPANPSDGDETTLFELYVMHSKGVALLAIKAPDLGWDSDNKVVDPVDGVAAGVVEIGKLKQPPLAQPLNQSTEETTAPIPVKLAVRPREAAPEPVPELPATRKAREEVSPAKQKDVKDQGSVATPPPEKTEKKPQGRKEKKKAAAERAAERAAALHERESTTTNGHTTRVVNTTAHTPAESPNASSTFSKEVDSRINSMEKRLTQSIIGSLQTQLTDLRNKMEVDVKSRDEKFDKTQGHLIRTVSECLNENVQDVLAKIVEDELQNTVTPIVGDVLGQAVSKSLDNELRSTVTESVQKHLQAAITHSIDRALQKPELAKSLSDKMVRTLASKIDDQLYSLLDDRILPRFTKVATDAASHCGKEILANVSAQFQDMESTRVQDMQKFEQLVALSTSMSDTLNTMVTAQARFQDEILRLQTQLAQQRQVSPPAQPSGRQAAPGNQGRGNGSYHSPSHSQPQALQNLNAAASAPIPQQQFNSPGAASQYTNPSVAVVSPAHQQQQWASNASSLVLSAPQQQQYSGHTASLQAANPNVLALQQSQQFGSPSTQASSQNQVAQQAHQLAREQVVFQPTSKENRQALDLAEICQRIRTNMNAGNYDDAVMTWIQESKEQEDNVFAQVLAKYDPMFIRNLNPLLLLTVAATVTAHLGSLDHPHLLHTKLVWTEIVLAQFYEALRQIEGQVREITPKVMTLIKSRLEHVFIRLSSTAPGDPALRNLSTMIDYTRKIAEFMGLSLAAPASSY